MDTTPRIAIGRIVAVYGPTNAYHVVGPYFDDIAVWCGDGPGTLGIRQCGGLAPGTHVLVTLGSGSLPSRIIAVDQFQTDPDVSAYNPRTLGDPDDQVSGYYQDSWERRILDSRLHTPYREFRNDGFQDLVNGEWGKVSYWGAGITVENFRASLRAGHFAEIAFYTDDQSGQRRSMKWSADTLFSTHHDTFFGNFPERRWMTYWNPRDAVSDEALPRVQAYEGPGHLGRHRVVAEQADRGTTRRALHYDYEDSGGIRVIGAAGGIILERRVDLDVPEERGDDDWGDDAIEELGDAVANPRGEIEFSGDTDNLLFAQSALDIADSITSWRARNAVDTAEGRWSTATSDPVSHNPGVPQSMWADLPDSIELVTDAGPKRFYVGRSCFALLPDGSFLVENAHGVQLSAVGPNLIISAPGDIIEFCGGVKQTFASGVVTRGNDFVQISSNDGPLEVKAERQLSMVGGVGGTGGVLIESKSEEDTSSVQGDGRVGGLVLKAKSSAFLVSERDVGISATQALVVKAASSVLIDSPSIAAQVTSVMFTREGSTTPGLLLSVGESPGATSLVVDGASIVRGDSVCLGSALVSENLVLGGSGVARGSFGAIDGVGELGGPDADRLRRDIQRQIDATDDALREFENAGAAPSQSLFAFINRDVPMREGLIREISFVFTPDYRGNLKANYGLPEMRWHQRSNGGQKWEEKGVPTSSGEVSMAYPGREVWEGSGVLFKAPDGLFFDAATGRSTMSKPESTEVQGVTAPLSDLPRRP